MSTYYLLMPGTLLRTGDVLDNPPSVGQGRGAPPLITVDTTGRAGQPLLVFGTDGVSTWWVRGARGSVVIDRSSYHLADPLAPLNVPVSYYIVDPDGTETMVTQSVRGYAGADLVTDLDGIHGVGFRRMRAGGDQRSPGLNVELFYVPGREPLPRYQPATTGGSSVTAWTEGEATIGMRQLLAASPLAVMLHNTTKCQTPCDVPRVQVVALTSAPEISVGTVDIARREWSLSATVIEDPFADILAPLSTVTMHDAYHAGMTVGEHDATYAAATVAEVDAMVWA